MYLDARVITPRTVKEKKRIYYLINELFIKYMYVEFIYVDIATLSSHDFFLPCLALHSILQEVTRNLR